MPAVHLAVVWLGVFVPSVAGCSILVDANQFVSPSVSASAGASGVAGSGAAEALQPSFVVVGGERDDIRNLGAFATDVTYGGFGKDGQVHLWPAWTLPAAGRYVAARQADRAWVFGDPDDTNDESALWSSEVREGVLAPWQRTSTAFVAPWAAVVVAEPDLIVIPSDATDRPDAALSLLSLQSPAELRPAGISLLTARLAGDAAICAGYLFVVGGRTRPESDPPVIAKVESASVGPSGLGPMTACADLQLDGAPLPRTNVALACNGSRLYVVGGDAMPYQNAGSVEVLSGAIELDGTINSWVEEPSLLYPVSRAAAVVVDERLVVVGGHNAARLRSVSYAKLDAEGHVTDWHLEGNDELPVAVQQPSAMALE